MQTFEKEDIGTYLLNLYFLFQRIKEIGRGFIFKNEKMRADVAAASRSSRRGPPITQVKGIFS